MAGLARALAVAAVLGCSVSIVRSGDDPEPPAVGELLERIQCPEGWEARVFAAGLAAPDGLAFGREGRVCASLERTGHIVRIDAGGGPTTLVEGLRSPEGLCRGAQGELFAVEDVAAGRLVAIDGRGELTVLAGDLDAPEGVVLLGDALYLTESTAQLSRNRFAARTRVLVLHRGAEGWSAPEVLLERGLPLSFSELAADGAGHLILANELAGGAVRAGLLRLELESGELEVFATGLVGPEGLAWTAGEPGRFPLYVAEEDVDGEGHGRVSCVDERGERTTFATGFGTLEDVLVGRDGRVYVSEDSTGMIVVLGAKR